MLMLMPQSHRMPLQLALKCGRVDLHYLNEKRKKITERESRLSGGYLCATPRRLPANNGEQKRTFV